ncbi:unnamed protein product [Sphagnum troendelagicum]
MRGIAMRLVALWGILHTIAILGFRNFVAVMVSGVEEEGSRRGTTTCDAIERHCSGVEQGADPEDSVSGVEDPAGEGFPDCNASIVSGVEEEEIHQATASAGIVSRVEEEGSRQGTTSDDIIASHISGAEEAAREVPVYSVEQAHGDDPTFEEGNEMWVSGGEENDRFQLLTRQRTRGKWLRSQVNPYHGRCIFKCVKIQENGSHPSPDRDPLVRSLKELEEAVEECNLILISLAINVPFYDDPKYDTNDPELEVTEELIELVMRIDKDHVYFPSNNPHTFLKEVFQFASFYNIPNLMKLVVGMVKSYVVCPMSPFVDKAAMDSAFMRCHTMPELLKLLLEFNPNFGNSWCIRTSANWKGHGTPSRMMQEYRRNLFDTDIPIANVDEVVATYLDGPKDEFQCYSCTNRECTLQNLTNQWKLDAHLTGLELPRSKNFNQTSQKIELQVLMEPSVLLNNSLTLKILNLKFHSDNAGSDANAGILSGFFLSGVALTATPEVDPQHLMSTQLGLGSANPARDMLFGTTLGTSATVPLGKDKEYPDPITWNFKPELEGTMVVWRISMEVYVTILKDSRSKSRSVSAGKTLRFCFARHLKHKLGTD